MQTISPKGEKHQFVLYADDDPDDRVLLEETFQIIAPDFKIKTVPSGFAAISFLETEPDPLPCLFIVDLNMPGMNGKEVIQKLKSNHYFRSMPIVVLTTSRNPADRLECERFGVDMISKPSDLLEFERTASKLLEYCR